MNRSKNSASRVPLKPSFCYFLPMKLHPAVDAVTRRIRERSAAGRKPYLARLDAAASRKSGAERLGCGNVAHAFAALPGADKFRVVSERAPNIGIVIAYNDMLSAYTPLQTYPELIKQDARLWAQAPK